MFARSRNIAITGGNFIAQNEVHRNTAFKELQKATAPNALHDSSARFDAPKCHPRTRVAILEYLTSWIARRTDAEAFILWLYGPAGAGKSAILQTIAEHCAERKRLLASFFFGRSDPTRNTFKPLVATIAYQVATVIPQVKPLIETVIEWDPLIFDKSISTQLQSLVINPLNDLVASGRLDSTCARLIIIDGIDECEDPHMQSMILRAIAIALRYQKLPLIFLIASRLELHINVTFNSVPLAGLWRSLVLDDSVYPADDIRLYLTDSFHTIKNTHPYQRYIPESWPQESEIEELVEKSSGQFIYASTVVRYISALNDLPTHALEIIRGLRPARENMPFAELDKLYMHILESCPEPDLVLQILGLIVSGVPMTVWSAEMLLDLEIGSVEVALAPLHSIIQFSTSKMYFEFEFPGAGDPIISLSHASFGDFLGDISRSSHFYINPLTSKTKLATICVHKLMHPPTADTIPRQHQFYPLFPMLGLSVAYCLRSQPDKFLWEGLSLPRIWKAWGPDTDIGLLLNTGPQRAPIIFQFLGPSLIGNYGGVISAKTLHGDQDIQRIHDFHTSSFEPIFKEEIISYYKDEGLLSLVVISRIFGKYKLSDSLFPNMHFGETLKALLQLAEEATTFDQNTFQLARFLGIMDLYDSFRHLLTIPSDTNEVYIDGFKFAQTALRILQFVCAYPPHPIRYRKSVHHKPRTHGTPKALASQSELLGQLSGTCMHQRISRTRNFFPRRRREEKHRYGVGLSFPSSEVDNKLIPYQFGLTILPEILARSTYSLELVTFIRLHGKKIAFRPKMTRQAIRALHEYLDRVDTNTV